MKILVVDDEEDFLNLAKIFLEQELETTHVETAQSAEEGFKKTQRQYFDAIVSDYQMPRMDGLDFLEKIREELGREIPFIIFTGRGREEVAMKALNMGADRYLQKRGDPKAQFGLLANAIAQEVKHRKTEKEWQRSEKEKRLILRSTSELISFQNTNLEIIWANKAAVESVDKTQEDIIGEKCYKIWHNREEPCENCPVLRAIKTGEPQQDEITTPDGREWLISGSPVKDEEGKVIGSVETNLEITERKRAEERFRNLFELGPDAAFFLDQRGTFKQINKAFCEKTGYKEEEILGRTPLELKELFSEESIEKISQNLEKALKSEEISPFNIEVHTKSDKTLYKEINIEIIQEGDKPSGIIGVARDITKQEKKEQKLRDSKERLESKNISLQTVNEIANGLYQIDEFQDVAKKSVEVMMEYTSSPSVALFTLNEETDTIDLIEAKGFLEESTETAKQMAPKDSLTGITIEKKKVTESRDISSDRRVQTEVRKSLVKKGYESVISIPLFSEEGVIGAMNLIFKDPYKAPNYEKEILLSLGKVIGLAMTRAKYISHLEDEIKKREMAEEKFRDFFDNIPDFAFILNEEGVVEEMNKTAIQESGYNKEELIGKSLRELPSFLPQNDREKTLERFKKILEGEKLPPITVKLTTKDREKRYFEMSSVPIWGDNRERKIIGVARDTTEREKAKEKEEFLHSLLRHNLKNKSQVVKGYMELMEETDLPKKGEEFLKKARNSIEEGVELVEKIEMLHNVKEQKVEEIEVDIALDNALNKNRRRATDAGIEVEYKKIGCKVKGGALLEELFSNLIENSVKHSDCSKIEISGKETDDKCIVTVEDNGKGVPDEIREKIFKKGYKGEESSGSGLGMFLAKRTAEGYGGEVEIKESELGGARFDVHLKKV